MAWNEKLKYAQGQQAPSIELSEAQYPDQVVLFDESNKESENLVKKCNDLCNAHARFILTNCYQAQTRGDWCGLASICTILKYCSLQTEFTTIDFTGITLQTSIYENYVKDNLYTPNGISMLHLAQILQTIISDYNLPFHLQIHMVDDYSTFTKQFTDDINDWIKVHSKYKHNTKCKPKSMANPKKTKSSNVYNNNKSNDNINNSSDNIENIGNSEKNSKDIIMNEKYEEKKSDKTGHDNGGNMMNDSDNNGDANSFNTGGNEYFFLLCNFWRKIGNRGMGHWSPIIDITSDLSHLLVADVAAHRIKPHWIKTDFMQKLMNTIVKSTQLPRGYITLHCKNSTNYNQFLNGIHHIYFPKRIASASSLLLTTAEEKAEMKSNDHNHNNNCNNTDTDTNINNNINNSANSKDVDSKTTSNTISIANRIDNNVYIREATICDSLLLAQLQLRAWHVTYKNILDDKFLFQSRSMTVTSKYTKWMKILNKNDAQNSKHTFLICNKYCKVLGYTTVSLPDKSTIKKIDPVLLHNGFNGTNGEMCTLYLDPLTPKRQGYGGMLFDFAFEFVASGFDWNKCVNGLNKGESFIENGKCLMSIWALFDNNIAMKFYNSKKCKIVSDFQRAHFGGKIYRYTGLVCGLPNIIYNTNDQNKQNQDTTTQN